MEKGAGVAPFIRGWEGNDWQEHVLTLLRSHYDPGQFQDVPDNHVGDFGIEGYSLDGCVYQCYAAQEPLSTNARYLVPWKSNILKNRLGHDLRGS
jgi:hypothetical protein